MFYKALVDFIDLRDDHADGATVTGEMTLGEVGRELEAGPDGSWSRIVIYSGFQTPRTGWIKLRDGNTQLAAEAPEPTRPEFGLWAFVKTCVDVETWMKTQDEDAKFFVLADYLIALASIETKIKNVGRKNPLTDGVGPYQLSSAQWAAFLADPLGANFDELDREIPLEQISGAAFLAVRSMNEISAGIVRHDVANGITETSGETGPYVPSYVDVLLAHMFGAKAAIDLRTAKMADKGGEPVAEILKPHFANDGELDTLFEHRSIVLKDAASGERETVDGMLINASKLLTGEFEKAFKLIEQHLPEDLPKKDGPAPWLAIAETEHADWRSNLTDETTAAGKNRVIDYFASTDSGITAVEPWCGAFAAHCLKTSGAPFDATVVQGSSRAANWKDWGNTSIPLGQNDVPKGAVVVLAPERGSARSGHVAFFSRYFGADNELVELLGGNQSDTVRLTKFARSKIAAIRWFSPAEADEKEAVEEAVTSTPDGRFGTLLKLIGLIEANSNYNAFYGKAGNTNNPKLTDLTINQVLEWQRNFTSVPPRSPSSAAGKYQFIRKTLRALRDNGVVSGSDTFDAATQDKLAIALLKGRGVGEYLSNAISEDQFIANLAKEWASFPVPVRMKGHSRTVEPGQSYYAGDNLNKALVKVDVVRSAVKTLLA